MIITKKFVEKLAEIYSKQAETMFKQYCLQVDKVTDLLKKQNEYLLGLVEKEKERTNNAIDRLLAKEGGVSPISQTSKLPEEEIKKEYIDELISSIGEDIKTGNSTEEIKEK